RPRWLQWSWWSWWLRRILGLLLVLIVGGVALYLLHRHRSQQRLEEALAEMDRDHPGWQWDEIEKARAPVPDHENGGLCVLAAGRHLPQGWTGGPAVELLPQVPAHERLTGEQARLLEAELGQRQDALVEARRLANRETGRFTV